MNEGGEAEQKGESGGCPYVDGVGTDKPVVVCVGCPPIVTVALRLGASRVEKR